jgi:hypothetical protein
MCFKEPQEGALWPEECGGKHEQRESLSGHQKDIPRWSPWNLQICPPSWDEVAVRKWLEFVSKLSVFFNSCDWKLQFFKVAGLGYKESY